MVNHEEITQHRGKGRAHCHPINLIKKRTLKLEMCLSSGKIKKVSEFSCSKLEIRIALGDVVNRQVDTLLQGYVSKQALDIKRNHELSRFAKSQKENLWTSYEPYKLYLQTHILHFYSVNTHSFIGEGRNLLHLLPLLSQL